MAKVDFWWDESEGNPPVDFRPLVREALVWRPGVQAPVLAVVGNIAHFRKCSLSKCLNHAGLVRAVSLDDLSDADIDRPGMAFIRWGHISPRHRSRLPKGVHVLNDTNVDTDKTNVEQKFAAVAGYSSFVDPTEPSGFAIVKSKHNARHDGRVQRLPLDNFDQGAVVCQRLIDNCIGDYVVDIRVPFLLGNPILAYLKFRERGRRFDNSNAHARLVMPAEVLTDAELQICQQFCRSMGLDYGELDILRDGRDGRIYIVDANDTPAGPTKALPELDRSMALRLIATAVRKYVFNQPC